MVPGGNLVRFIPLEVACMGRSSLVDESVCSALVLCDVDVIVDEGE